MSAFGSASNTNSGGFWGSAVSVTTPQNQPSAFGGSSAFGASSSFGGGGTFGGTTTGGFGGGGGFGSGFGSNAPTGSTSGGLFGATGSAFGGGATPLFGPSTTTANSGFGSTPTAPSLSSFGATPAFGGGTFSLAPSSSSSGWSTGPSFGGTPSTTFGSASSNPTSAWGSATSASTSSNAARPISQNAARVLPTTFEDTISSLAWAPNGPLLAVSSWDGSVNMCRADVMSCKVLKVHNAPILDVAFSRTNSHIFTAGADNVLMRTNFATEQPLPLIRGDAAHTQAIRCLSVIREGSALLAGSFDNSVSVWDEQAGQMRAKLQVPDRVYAMATEGNHVVVACAERSVAIFDLRSLERPVRTLSSPLKFMTRAVEIAPNSMWFAITSIEARCAVVHFDESTRDGDFSFKCHRRADDVFPVNDISFHPSGIFATVGNDNCLTIWDKESRTRLRSNQIGNGHGPGLIKGKFNPSGDLIAVASAYDWSQGPSRYDRSPGSVTVVVPGPIERRNAPPSRR